MTPVIVWLRAFWPYLAVVWALVGFVGALVIPRCFPREPPQPDRAGPYDYVPANDESDRCA